MKAALFYVNATKTAVFPPMLACGSQTLGSKLAASIGRVIRLYLLAKEQLISRHFADCGEDLKRVIRSSNDELIPRKMYVLPVVMQWQHRRQVTLIGASAHLMTLFAGVGVNLGMRDALDLAKKLVENQHDLGSAIKDYEQEMFKWALAYAQKTRDNVRLHFSAHGTEERAAKLRAQYEKLQVDVAGNFGGVEGKIA